MKLKIKETYLILLIVISLISLGVYSTYALFTASTTIEDVVGITATLDIGKSISEYEIVSVDAGETKLIELNVVNSSLNTIYYGAWYKIVEGNSEDIDIGLYTDVNFNSSSGTLTSNGTIKLLVGITNNSDTTITVYLGVKGSNTNELNLGTDKILLPSGWTDILLVTDEVLEQYKVVTTSTEEVNKSFSTTGKNEVTLDAGTYKLEVWGAQGGSYNETYATGGKGGYSYGTLTLTETTNLYVYVGGKGSYGTSSTYTAVSGGGTNGGGNAGYRGGGGGGASDIRINTDSLYARVIVAGGGGGAYSYDSSYKANGGAGGGTSGVDGSYYSSYSTFAGKGATQTVGGSSGTEVTSGDFNGNSGMFGVGGDRGYKINYTSYYSNGAGGGGWYGGGAADNYTSFSRARASGGGGGSGYVYTSSTASNYPSRGLLNSTYYLTNAATVAGNTSFTDYDGSTVTGHSGNGYAKITGTSTVSTTIYTIPHLKNLTTLNVSYGQSVDLTSDLELICENNQTTGCSITSTSITDTSSLELGTYTVTYKVTGSNNKKYLFDRTINVIIKANSPDLVDGLIPIMHNGTSWVKADSTNSNNSWYDYNNKLWANAVLVKETNRSTYQNASVGTEVTESDILAFYVWIPRYKYKVWNIKKQVGIQSYNAKAEGIDIIFETEKETTGTITCTYSYASPSSSEGSPNEVCTGSNGDYYTHPAFTFGTDELRGFWIGKFEVSSSSSSSNYGGGTSTSLSVRILPNVTSWRYNSLSNFNTVIQNMQGIRNIYGLSTSRTVADSHMLTNMEWGAVSYLTNSKYGRCTNGSCTQVAMNGYGETSNYTTKTGCGPISNGSTSYGTTCNAYNTILGMTSSTTGNITGVYDMVGGANEYVMGNISSVAGSYTFYSSNGGFSSNWYTSNTKYVTTYAYDSSNNSNQAAYNRSRLGDATGEIILDTGGAGGWYGYFTIFPYSSYSWFGRGGAFDGSSGSGLFTFTYGNGTYGYSISSRASLVSLS